MTKHNTRVSFDDNGSVVISGKIGGRSVEYSGIIKDLNVEVDDGVDAKSFSWHAADYSPEKTTYSLTFEQVDGKAMTAKIGKKPVERSASVHYGFIIHNRHEIRRIREELSVPVEAKHKIDFDAKKIIFTWTEEV